jgi:hypothetical protein
VFCNVIDKQVSKWIKLCVYSLLCLSHILLVGHIIFCSNRPTPDILYILILGFPHYEGGRDFLFNPFLFYTFLLTYGFSLGILDRYQYFDLEDFIKDTWVFTIMPMQCICI